MLHCVCIYNLFCVCACGGFGGGRPEYVKDRGRSCTPLRTADLAVVHRRDPLPPPTTAEPMGRVARGVNMSGAAGKYLEESFQVEAEGGEDEGGGGDVMYDSFEGEEGQGGEDVAYDFFDGGGTGGGVPSTGGPAWGGGGGGEVQEDVMYDYFDDDITAGEANGRGAGADADGGGARISSTDAYEEVNQENDEQGRTSCTTKIVEVDMPAAFTCGEYGEFTHYNEVCYASKYDEESPPHSDDEGSPTKKRPTHHPSPTSYADPSLPPGPLSPDALSAFSNFDPYAVDRNREVIRATERLIKEVIPAFAKQLAGMSPLDVCSMDFSVCFHVRGINMRHMGLVRSLIPHSNATSAIRTSLLLQIVSRTLKNITRDYQRRWMKSEQSTSEQGMHMLLTEVLNLVVGSNTNSDTFWTDKVVVGIMQRFGACSLDNRTDHIHELRKRPQFLKVLV